MGKTRLAIAAAQHVRDMAAREVGVLHPFAHDGHAPAYHTGPGHFGVTFLKKGTPERTKMLLGVLNVLAAPFGTQEWMLANYDVDKGRLRIR